MTTFDLVGPDEIAARLGVRSNTVSMWRARGLLPAPFATVSRVPMWPWRLIRAWADATGRLGSDWATPKVSRDEVNAARAIVVSELDALADDALGILESCGVSTMIRKPSARAAIRDQSGRYLSLDGRGSRAGEYDWLFALADHDRLWLTRSHMGPETTLSAPDQVAAQMIDYTGTDEIDTCMAEWVRCLRVIDAANAVRGRITWRRCSHLFAGLTTTYDVGSLFGTYSDAASYLAALRTDTTTEDRELVTRLGPSPMDMDFGEWATELKDLEHRATMIEAPTGEWDILTAENQAVFDRLEELLPSTVAIGANGTIEDAYVAVVALYLGSVAA